MIKHFVPEIKDHIAFPKSEQEVYSRGKELFDGLGYIPEDLKKKVLDGPSSTYHSLDIMLENLNSHDVHLLVKELNRKFPNTIVDSILTPFTKGEELRSVELVFRGENTAQELSENSKFKSIVEFYGYLIGNKVPVGAFSKMFLEPEFSDSADKYIFGDCNGIVWHFTKLQNWDSISRTGLRCKKKSGDREYPERVYLYATPVASRNMDFTGGDISILLKQLFLGSAPVDIAAIRVDLNKLGWRYRKDHTGVYMRSDTAMGVPGTVFSYTNIPSSVLKLYGTLHLEKNGIISIK